MSICSTTPAPQMYPPHPANKMNKKTKTHTKKKKRDLQELFTVDAFDLLSWSLHVPLGTPLIPRGGRVEQWWKWDVSIKSQATVFTLLKFKSCYLKGVL